VIVVDRLVPRTAVNRTNVLVERISAERYRLVFIGTAQAPVHRLANHGGDAHAAPQSGVSQLAVGLLGKAEVGDDVAGHGGITISRYR
jgi:hypothetical protein